MPDSRERWFVDGWEVSAQSAYAGWTSYDGLYSAAELLGENIRIPGRHGQLWTPKTLGPGSFALNFYLGTTPAEGRVDLVSSWEQIVRRVKTPHRQARFERWLPDGSKRECYGQVIAEMQPTSRGQYGIIAQLEVNVPSGFWTDLADLDSGNISLGSGAVNNSFPLTAFINATAPLTGLRVGVTGPTTSQVTVTDDATGSWFRSNQNVTTGLGEFGVNAATDNVSTNYNQLMTYRGPYMIEVGIPTDQVPRLRVQTTAGAGAYLNVTGRRQYLM